MRWPSKDRGDYMTRGRWEDNPPPWLARLRGTPNPDPVPLLLACLATVLGLAAGAVAEIIQGPGASLMLPFLGVLLARTALDATWWLTRRHRQARHWLMPPRAIVMTAGSLLAIPFTANTQPKRSTGTVIRR